MHMELEDLRQHFPPMPEEIRLMVEQEVQKQIRIESPDRRKNHMTRKALIMTFAAAMLLGTSVFAGVVYKMRTEKVGDYAVKTKIEQTTLGETDNTTPSDKAIQDVVIQDVSMEVSYLPKGMVKTEDGKYSFEDNLYKGASCIIQV